MFNKIGLFSSNIKSRKLITVPRVKSSRRVQPALGEAADRLSSRISGEPDALFF
jgi:hypothetical protein